MIVTFKLTEAYGYVADQDAMMVEEFRGDSFPLEHGKTEVGINSKVNVPDPREIVGRVTELQLGAAFAFCGGQHLGEVDGCGVWDFEVVKGDKVGSTTWFIRRDESLSANDVLS